jgi:DNA-binding SARP family transcriptional activator
VAGVEFRILGPLEVVENDRTLELGGQKQRTLLAALLLEPNHVVSSDRLVEALWDQAPPETALKALQVYVSQLRKVIGRSRLETAPPGYRLRVEDGELDVARFVRLAEEGKPAEALALWRGPPLSDFTYQRFAAGEIGRLTELRLACLEARIDEDLLHGRHAELVGELEQLVREHPLHEPLRVQLILALYRCGRQAEALDAYREARQLLVDELGIEPSRRLRELQQGILVQDPALDAPVAEAEEPAPAPAGEPMIRAGRKTVSVLVVGVDLASASGVTLDPETVLRLAARWCAEVQSAAERHGGKVELVASESLTAVFGLPTLHEDDAVRAVRASADVSQALEGLAAELSSQDVVLDFRVGIATGEVVTGEAGPAGEPFARAARLQAGAEAGAIVLDDATSRRSARRARRFVSPMVGREREQSRLLEAFERALADRSCELVTILGPAGVGKSRLVQEFVDGLQGRALVASGRCLPYGEGITFWPLFEAVKDVARLDDAEPAEVGRARIATVLEDEPDGDLVARAVAGAVGLGAPPAGSGELFAAVLAFFAAAARRQPLVLVFDDIHWGEPTFLDLVDHLTGLVRDVPFLVVCVARPELLEVRPGWGGGKLNAVSALLEPLTPGECGRLIENLVGASGLAAEVTARIAEAAEGNPLFVEEMLSMLVDEGVLAEDGGSWTAVGDLTEVPVPPSIQALLAARLERLSDEERLLLERASVAGKVFQLAAVEELGADVGALEPLVRKDLIRPERSGAAQQTYRFRHLLIRDSAYEGIPKETRAGLHERFARWLEASAAGRAIEVQEVVGYHLEQAHRYLALLGPLDGRAEALGREAAERLGVAGRRAFASGDTHAGLNLVSRAVELLPATDPLLLELVPSVRVVQGARARLGWADRVLTEAVEAAATTGDRRLAAHALVQRGLLRLFTEVEVSSDDLIATAERAIPVLEESGDELGLSRAWRLVAQAHYLARRAARSLQASEQAYEHARRVDDRYELLEVGEWLTVGLLGGPMAITDAIPRLDLMAAASHLSLRTCALGVLGAMAAMQGRYGDADALLARGREAMAESGENVWFLSLLRGYVDFWRGDLQAAEDVLRGSYEALVGSGDGAHFSTITSVLADVLQAQKRYEEAERVTHEVEAATRPNDVFSHTLWRSVRAKALARLGEPELAVELAREAVGQVAGSDFLFPLAGATADLGDVLAVAGHGQEAREAAAEAVRLHELKGNSEGAARARALA